MMTEVPMKEIQELRERIISMEVESRVERKWLVLVGIFILGLLGYTNFIAIPRETSEQLPDAVKSAVAREAPLQVQAAFRRWIAQNNGTVLLANIRNSKNDIIGIHREAVDYLGKTREVSNRIQEIEARKSRPPVFFPAVEAEDLQAKSSRLGSLEDFRLCTVASVDFYRHGASKGRLACSIELKDKIWFLVASGTAVLKDVKIKDGFGQATCGAICLP